MRCWRTVKAPSTEVYCLTACFHSTNSELPLKPTRNVEGRRSKGLKRLVLSYLASLSKYLTEVVLQLMQPFERSHPWFPERLLLMCSLCLSLILNGVFTSQLASSFSKRMYYDDIDTLEQLEESGETRFNPIDLPALLHSSAGCLYNKDLSPSRLPLLLYRVG